MLAIKLLFLCGSIVFSMAMGLYTDMDSVIGLSPMNFDQQVLDNQKLVAVEFYASWCVHCRTFASDWMEVAEKLKGMVTVSAIQCDDDVNQDICAKYNVNRYPTIKIFKTRIDDEGVIVKSTRDYYGPRDSTLLVKHLLSNLPSKIRSIKWNTQKAKSRSIMSLDEFLGQENRTLAKVILFNDKRKTMAPYNALSMDFGDGKLLMGEVKKAEKKVVDNFGITTFPTLLVLLPGEGDRISKYGGKFNYKSLYKYLLNIVTASTSGSGINGGNLGIKTADENQKYSFKHKDKSLRSKAFSDSFGSDDEIQNLTDSIVKIENNGGGVTGRFWAEQDDDGLNGNPLVRDEL